MDEPDRRNYAVLRKGPASLKHIWPAGYPQSSTLIVGCEDRESGMLFYPILDF